MKKFILLLAALFICFANANAQFGSTTCLPEGITFTSQAQIDNFQTDYPGCKVIEGNVTIRGSDTTNLNGLSVLTSVGGYLQIGKYSYGNALTNLMGLDNLTSIGGYLDIQHNNALASLTGLENLNSIGGYLNIQSNNALTNLTGLNNLTSIGGSVSIRHNNFLASLTGLENLTSIEHSLQIESNNTLTSLTGLGNLTSIGDYLKIINNSSLSTCDAQWLCDYLAAPTGEVNIYNNATGCSSIIDVATTCGGLPCLPYGNYYFHSQADIDNFQAAFPNCTELQGNVTIQGNNITNLNGLSVLTSIGGYLYINENNTLTRLTGLDNLTSIGGYLYIYENNTLTSLTGLENLPLSGVIFILD